jgi:hypothetical protein
MGIFENKREKERIIFGSTRDSKGIRDEEILKE